MGAWLIVLGGGFFFNPETDRATAVLFAIAGVYAILWQEPALLGYTADEFIHVSLAQPGFLFFLSAAIFLWGYWLFQRHVEMLEDAGEELSEALVVEKTLLDILSHDLRNPLTVLQNRLAAVAKGHASYEDHAEGVAGSLQRVERIIDNSVLYSRLSSDGSIETEPLDLTRLTEDALDAFHGPAVEDGARVELDAPGPIPVEVTPLIQHAIENLVDNALKHSPEGRPVHVRLSTAGETARIVVEDHGPGLSSEERDRLFERFQRGDQPNADGSGLGLAIVRRLVDLHDGRLAVEDTPGGGARVVLELPRHQGAGPRPSGPQEPTTATPTGDLP